VGDLAKKDDPKDKLERLIEVNLDWSSLIPEVSPITEADAQDAAIEFLTEYKVEENNPIWKKVLEQAKTVARQRAAELVGKKVLKDGTIVDNPSAAWSITETTRGNLRELVSESIENGWTTGQLQHRILESEDFSPSRALNISRTETAFARAQGTHEAAKGTGMKYKDWMLGAEACDVCQENADAGRIGIDDSFPSGDETPPGHPNCRCAAGYYESEDGD
jgi:hypothetical protein